MTITSPITSSAHNGVSNSRSTLDHRALDHRALDHRALDHRALDHRALDHRALDHRALDHRALDHRALDHRALDHRALDHREHSSAHRPLRSRSLAPALTLALGSWAIIFLGVYLAASAFQWESVTEFSVRASTIFFVLALLLGLIGWLNGAWRLQFGDDLH